MRKILLILLLLAVPVWAQDELAGPGYNVLLCGEFGYRARLGDKETKRVARPTVMTADGHEAEILLGLPGGEVGDNKVEILLRATPTVIVEGERKRVRMKMWATARRGEGRLLSQGCTLTSAHGDPVEFVLQTPEGGEVFVVEVTPYLMGPGQGFQGYDKDGKPIIR